MFPGYVGEFGWAFLIGGVVAGIAIVAIAAWLGSGSRPALVPFAFVLGVAVVLRLLIVALVPSPIETDWANYNRLAIEIAQRGPFLTSVPTGWPMLLAIPYALFGEQHVLGELLNVVAGAITTSLVFVLTDRAFGRPAAAIAGALFAIFPSQLLMTAVLGAETVYATLIIGVVAAAIAAMARPTLRAWIVVGGLLGLSQYVRAASLIALPALAVLPFLVLRGRAPLTAVVALVLSFVVVLGPVIAWQRIDNGVWSVSTSMQSNWNLLVGLNQEHDGSFNTDDEKLVGLQRGTQAFEQRAGELARERLFADPVGLASLAVRKFPQLWGSEAYGAYWALQRSKPNDQAVSLAMLDLSQIAWAAVTVAATVGLFSLRRAQPPLGWALILIVGGMAIAHSFLEIQPRYHAHLVALVCCLAAPAIGALFSDRPILGGPAAPGRGTVERYGSWSSAPRSVRVRANSNTAPRRRRCRCGPRSPPPLRPHRPSP